MHEPFADWLERTAGERLHEFEEIVGHHLEQAYRDRSELGEEADPVGHPSPPPPARSREADDRSR